MATVGKVIGYPMSTRWAFEGLGADLRLDRLYGKAARRWDRRCSPMAVLLLAGACAVLARKCRRAGG
jgi:hypothetical protein